MNINIGRYETIIDDEDYARIAQYSWYANKSHSGKIYFYRLCVNTREKRIIEKLHRYLVGAPIGRVVDHVNGNTQDNRKCNLRICSNLENARNCKKYKTNTSGYKGVSYYTRHRKWATRISVNNKCMFLGLYKTPEEAYMVYCEASKKYHGEFGRTL